MPKTFFLISKAPSHHNFTSAVLCYGRIKLCLYNSHCSPKRLGWSVQVPEGTVFSIYHQSEHYMGHILDISTRKCTEYAVFVLCKNMKNSRVPQPHAVLSPHRDPNERPTPLHHGTDLLKYASKLNKPAVSHIPVTKKAWQSRPVSRREWHQACSWDVDECLPFKSEPVRRSLHFSGNSTGTCGANRPQ